MKKVIAILTLLLTLTSCNGNTLPPQNLTPNGETVTPSGAITVVSDNLDSDVESLTQGLQTVVMSKLGAFVQNPTAIESMTTYNNADGTKTYTFTLYPDLKFSDNNAVTAKDYLFSVLVMDDFPAVLGYKEYKSGEKVTFKGLRLISDYKFSVTLSADAMPNYYESSLVAITPYPMSVLCPEAEIVDTDNGVYIKNVTAIKDDKKVTSGAYYLMDMTSDTASLRLNPYFKGNYEKQKPTIEIIKITTKDIRADIYPNSKNIPQGNYPGSEFKSTPHQKTDIANLLISKDIDFASLFNVGEAEVEKIKAYLLETGEFDTESYLKKVNALNLTIPESELVDYSLSWRIRNYTNISGHWDWTNQILYCWIARE